VAKAALIKQGKLPAAIKPVLTLPPEAARLWAAFVDLDDGRDSGFNSANPITYAEIVARGVALDDPLEPWEVRGVRALDRIRRRGEPGGAQ
jgi:hypothetical protein